MNANEVLLCKLDNDVLQVKCFEHDGEKTITCVRLEGFGEDGELALSGTVSFSNEHDIESFVNEEVVPHLKKRLGDSISTIDNAKIEITVVRMTLQRDCKIISSIVDFIFAIILLLPIQLWADTATTNGFSWTYTEGILQGSYDS